MDIEPKSKAKQFTRRVGRNEQESGGPTATGIQAGRYRLTRLMGRCLSVPLTGRYIQSLFLQTGGGRERREGGSRLRLAGAARQTGFPDSWETASEWDRGTYTCCFRRPSSSRSPERASASTAAASITTSRHRPRRRERRLRSGTVVHIRAAFEGRRRRVHLSEHPHRLRHPALRHHRLQSGSKSPAQTFKLGSGTGLQSGRKDKRTVSNGELRTLYQAGQTASAQGGNHCILLYMATLPSFCMLMDDGIPAARHLRRRTVCLPSTCACRKLQQIALCGL